MTAAELIALLSEEFYENFADDVARRVRDADAVGLLYAAATSPHEGLARPARHKVLFRSAYVLERIYFDNPAAFAPYAEAFCRSGFAACTDPGAQRHFTKIMADLLRTSPPGGEALDRIARCAAEWMLDPATKIAVRANALDVLSMCRERIEWVADSWEDLIESLARDASPGIASRLRRMK